MTGQRTDTTATRRDRVRVETAAEIKARSWALMAHSGAQALSLRAVARQMGMAPSALYRYFASRDDLLTAMIVDEYSSLADALGAAYDQERSRQDVPPAGEVFVVVCRAYRTWVLAHPTQYRVMFAAPIPGYEGTDQTKEAAARSTALLLRIAADLVAEGGLDSGRIDRELPPELVGALTAWSTHGGADLPPAALAAAMWGYAALHGALHLDANNHLPDPLRNNAAMFESTIRAVVSCMTGGSGRQAG